MSPVAILLLCLQACIIQSVMSTCSCGLGAGSLASINNVASINNAAAINAAVYNSAANNAAAINTANAINSAAAINNGALGYWPGSSGYSAYGSGDVALAGELGVSGSTSVAGSVPVTGGLTFSGLVPASGLVTISGSCAYPQSYVGAELAELAVLNAGLSAYPQPSLYGAGLGADLAELAILNAGLSAYPQPSLYGAGLGATISGAELAGLQQWNNIIAPSTGYGCNNVYY